MFDIGFPELMVVSIVALLILGPERLPEALRTLGLWLGRLRRSFTAVKTELEKELGMDDIRRQLHNESVMEEMQRIEAEVQKSLDTNTDTNIDTGADAAAHQNTATENTIKPPDSAAESANPDTTAPPTTASSTTPTTTPSTTPTDQPADVADDRVRNS